MKLSRVQSRALVRHWPTSATYFLVAALLLGIAGLAVAAPTPSAPLNLTATALSGSEIQVDWDFARDKAASYSVERSVGNASSFTLVATVPADTRSYLDTGLALSTTYYYRAYASNKKGDSPYSNIASATTTVIVAVPAAPSGLSAAEVSTSQINLAWTDNAGNENGFDIERSLSASSGFAQIATVGANVTSYASTGLSAGTTYYYRVRAYNSAGDSAYSNTAGATTTAIVTVPAAPSGLSAAEVSASQINLAWTDNAGNENGFDVERSLSAGSGFAQIATVGANVTSYASTGLSADTTYYYRVRAYNSAGDSAYSNTAGATTTTVPPASGPPAAPSDLTATGAADHINLNWADNSTNEDRFDIWRRAGAGYWLPLTQVAANATSYSDYSAQPDILYYYLVRAHNTAGSSAWSNTASAMLDGVGSPEPPTAPSGVSATAISSSRINLTWSDTSDSEDGFRIERSLSTSSGFAQIATVGANVTSYASTGLAAGTTYYYRVRAYNSTGNSLYSNTASATTTASVTVPAAPSSLIAAAVWTNQIDLSWTDNSTNESGFKIERSLSSTTGFSQIATVGVDVVSYSDSSLSASTTYYYRVRAYNAAGNSAYSNTASASTGQTVPSAPTNLNATPASSSAINLSWTDASSNETGFKIERSFSVTSGFSQIATVGANVTSYSNTGLSPGTLYAYRVRAYNAAGNSAYSNTAVTNTLDVPPAAPSGLSATAMSSSQIDLTWVDNSANETGFDIARSLSATSGFAVVASVGANVTSYQNTGLSPSTTYYYRVRARNTAGVSGYSNTSSATTGIQATVPLGLVVDVVTDGAYAYTASQHYGLVVVDVSDASNPRGVAAVDVGFPPRHLASDESLVVLAGGFYGLAVVDVSAPPEPIVVGALDSHYVFEVAISGDVAFVTDPVTNCFRVVELLAPLGPSVLAELPLAGTPYEIAVVGDYCYVASTAGLFVVEVGTPDSPHVVGQLSEPCLRVTAEPGYAYVDGAPGGGIKVVDISDATAPTVIREHSMLALPRAFVVEGNTLISTFNEPYGTVYGLWLMDVTDRTSTRSTAARETPGQAYGVAAYGGYAFVADGPPGLHVFDVSDPYDPILVGTAQ